MSEANNSTAPDGAEAVIGKAERRPTTEGSRAEQCGSVYSPCSKSRTVYHPFAVLTYDPSVQSTFVRVAVKSLM